MSKESNALPDRRLSQAEELTPPVRGRRISRGLTDTEMEAAQADMLSRLENDDNGTQGSQDVPVGTVSDNDNDDDEDCSDEDSRALSPSKDVATEVPLHDSPPVVKTPTNTLRLPDPPLSGSRGRTISDITPDMRSAWTPESAGSGRERTVSNASVSSTGSGPDLRWQHGILRKRGTFFMVEFPEHGLLAREARVFNFKAHRGSANALRSASDWQARRAHERTRIWHEQSLAPISKQFVDGLYDMSSKFLELVRVEVPPQHISALSSGNRMVKKEDFTSVIDYNWASGHCVQSELPPFEHSVQSIAIDDFFLACGTYAGEVTLWRWGSMPDQYGGRAGLASGVVFESPGGRCRDIALGARYLVSATTLKTIAVWGVEESKLLHVQNAHKAIVNVVSFSPDEKFLASGSEDTTFKIWHVRDGGRLDLDRSYTWVHSTVLSCHYSRDKVAVGYANGSVIVASHEPGSPSLTVLAGVQCHETPIYTLQAHGDTVATGSDGCIRVWKLVDGRPSEMAEGTEKTLISRGTLQTSSTGSTVNALQFEGDRLVAVCGKQVQVWTLGTAQVMYFRDHPEGKLLCLAFKGATLVTGGHPGSVTLWDYSETPPRAAASAEAKTTESVPPPPPPRKETQ